MSAPPPPPPSTTTTQAPKAEDAGPAIDTATETELATETETITELPANLASQLRTPQHAIADFCIIPLGTGTTSVAREVALVQRFLSSTGVKFVMHSAGTTLEGSWETCTHLIGQCHTLLHEYAAVSRIQSDIRIGSRTDKQQAFEDKVARVRGLLGEA